LCGPLENADNTVSFTFERSRRQHCASKRPEIDIHVHKRVCGRRKKSHDIQRFQCSCRI